MTHRNAQKRSTNFKCYSTHKDSAKSDRAGKRLFISSFHTSVSIETSLAHRPTHTPTYFSLLPEILQKYFTKPGQPQK